MSERIVTPEQWSEVPSLVQTGWTDERIALRLGVTVGTLRVTASLRGISLRRPDNTIMTREKVDQIPGLIELGWDVRKIAAHFECTPNTIYNACSKNHIQLPRGRHYSRWTGTDWCTADGAEKLAQMIRDYWAKRGHHPEVWLDEPVNANEKGLGMICCLRSDMVSGWPQRQPVREAA